MADCLESATPNSNLVMKSKKEVTILGGGLAGLAAAVVLSDQGLQVTLVERKPFLGGRASSYPVPNSHRPSFPDSAGAPDVLPANPSNEEQTPPPPAKPASGRAATG